MLGGFPVLTGVERLIILVDHDEAGLTAGGDLRGALDPRRTHRRAADAGAPRRRLQRHWSCRSSRYEPEPQRFTAKVSTPAPEGSGVKIDDFVAYMPAHNYIFTPCREPWPASAVNARLKRVPVLTKSGQPKRDKSGKPITMAPSTWLDQNRPVEQMTWCPGLPMLIKDRLVVARRLDRAQGCDLLQSLSPAAHRAGRRQQSRPLARSRPQDLSGRRRAHHHVAGPPRAAPDEKINHALVLGGAQGIGKDSMLAPVRYAVGTVEFPRGDRRPICWAGSTASSRP